MEEPLTISSTYHSLLWSSSDDTFINSTFFDNSTAVVNATNNKFMAKFYPIFIAEMMLSILCLILTIIVYSILPEFKNVHGKNVISFSSCLLTTYIFLSLDIILRRRINYSFCFAIAVVIHFTFLATLFWMNVMSYDIWSNMTKCEAKCDVKSKSRRYLKYSIYAWTATALTALPAVVLESTNLVPLAYRPQFGKKRCWLSGKTAFSYYFNLPSGVVLFGNMVMFILTIKKLHQIKKMTAILAVKQQQQRLNLYLKLFFVMGLIWMTEFLPWATKIHKLYALANMLAALHGVLLFVIFVLKKRILRQIWMKMTGKEIFTKSSSSHSTSSSSTAHLTNQANSKA